MSKKKKNKANLRFLEHLNLNSIPDTSSHIVNSTINSTDTDMERVMLNVKSVSGVLYTKTCEETSNKQL